MSASPLRSKSCISLRSQSTKNPFAGFANELVAHDNAVTAAERAFNKETAGHYLTDGRLLHQRSSTAAIDQTSLAPMRRQSIRFATSTAIPSRDNSTILDSSSTCMMDQQIRSSTSSVADLDFGVPEKPNHLEQYQPVHDALSTQDLSIRPGSKGLSRAKSMFLPHRPSVQISHPESPKVGRHLRRRSVRSSGSLRPSCPNRKKGTSLITLSQNTKTSPPSVRHDLSEDRPTVRLAREEFLRQQDQQLPANDQRSLPYVLKKQNMIQKMRRSGRTAKSDMATEKGCTANGRPEPVKKPFADSSSAQRLSSNLRSKLKAIFQRGAHKSVDLPAQHVEASWRNFSHNIIRPDDEALEIPQISPPSDQFLGSIDSREMVEPWTSCTASEGNHSQMVTSASSCYGSDLFGSRIASWSDSTALSSVKLPSALDGKPLSVINENLDLSETSPSPYANAKSPSYTAFRQPLRPSPHATQLETQRVFSALQKEIERKNSDHILGEQSSEDGTLPEGINLRIRNDPASSDSDLGIIRRGEENLSDNVANLHNTGSLDRRTKSKLRGILRETGSSLFPASKLIQRERGTSPFRTSRMKNSLTRLSALKQSAKSDPSYQTTLVENAVPENDDLANAYSESIYSSNSASSLLSAISRDPASSGMIKDFGTACISEPSCGLGSACQNWSKITPKITQNPANQSTRRTERQFNLGAQANSPDLSLTNEDDTAKDILWPQERLSKHAKTNQENDRVKSLIDERALEDVFDSLGPQKPALGLVGRDRARYHPSDKSPLEDITPHAKNSVPQDQGVTTIATCRGQEGERHILPESSRLEVSPLVSVQSRDGPVSSLRHSAYRDSLQHLERTSWSRSQSPHLSNTMEASLHKGVRVGYVSHSDNLGSQIAVTKNSSSQFLPQVAETVATSSAKDMVFHRSQLVDSLLRDKRRGSRTNITMGNDAAFL